MSRSDRGVTSRSSITQITPRAQPYSRDSPAQIKDIVTVIITTVDISSTCNLSYMAE